MTILCGCPIRAETVDAHIECGGTIAAGALGNQQWFAKLEAMAQNSQGPKHKKILRNKRKLLSHRRAEARRNFF